MGSGWGDDEGTSQATAWAGSFAPEAASAGRARLAASAVLVRSGVAPVVHDFGLIILGELVSNAVRHARTWFRVAVTTTDRAVRIEVRDGSPRPPKPVVPDVESTNGRGLHIVARLATDWGWHPDREPGKVVWAEVAR